MRIALLFALALAACVPPPAPQSTASSSGGATCETVCPHLVDCAVVPDVDGCVSDCHTGGYDTATITRFQNASCENINAMIAEQPATDAPSGAHTCSAEGIYEVCDGEYCRDQTSESSGAGDTKDAAASDAVQACNTHMTNMVIASQIDNRASVKSSCEVTRCN